jgi:alpha-N-arabinofuranosidase
MLAGFYPDPSVCVVDGRYYLANSSFEYFPGIPLHVSDDFENWTPLGHAVDRPTQLTMDRAYDSGGLYAPAIRHHRGTFYLACTSFGEAGADGYGSFYLTATDPAGDWSDATFLPEARGFDPSLFFDGDTVWWIGCRERENAGHSGDTEIWMRELDLSAGRLVGDEHILWRSALRVGVWSEGPHIHERNGWYYLLTAEGGTDLDHAVMVARSRSVTGPYEGFPRNPLFTHRHLGRTAPVRNVGHADLVEGPDGDWRMVMLGSRQHDDRVMLGRETYGASVVWQDDWPVVNPGHGQLLGVESVPLTLEGAPARLADFVTARAQTSAFADGESGIVATAGELTPGRQPGVWRRLQHSTADLGFSVELLDATAGVSLVLRQSDNFGLSLTVVDRVASVAEWRAGVETVLGSVSVRGPLVHLAAHVRPSDATFSIVDGTEGTEVATVSTAVLTTEVAGGFVGTMFGVRPSGAPGSRVRVSGWNYDGR